jgi:hypothetical protein
MNRLFTRHYKLPLNLQQDSNQIFDKSKHILADFLGCMTFGAQEAREGVDSADKIIKTTQRLIDLKQSRELRAENPPSWGIDAVAGYFASMLEGLRSRMSSR